MVSFRIEPQPQDVPRAFANVAGSTEALPDTSGCRNLAPIAFLLAALPTAPCAAVMFRGQAELRDSATPLPIWRGSIPSSALAGQRVTARYFGHRRGHRGGRPCSSTRERGAAQGHPWIAEPMMLKSIRAGCTSRSPRGSDAFAAWPRGRQVEVIADDGTWRALCGQHSPSCR